MRGYTLLQLRTFTEAAGRAQRREMADQVSNMRAAQYESKDFKAYLKTLTNG